MKAIPPCPPSNRLLNLIKYGIEFEQNLKKTEAEQANDRQSSILNKLLQANGKVNSLDIDIDTVGELN
jgi:hypothetical protein